MSPAQITAWAGLATAIGAGIAAITALISTIKAHGRISALQGQQSAGGPPSASQQQGSSR